MDRVIKNNTSIKQSDTDKTELTEIVGGKLTIKVTARIDINSEGGQQVTFHSALKDS